MLKLTQTNNQEITMLLKALNNVKISYLKQLYNKVTKGVQNPERVFVAELYHQLRVLQENKSNPAYSNLNFHVETNKQSLGNLLHPCIQGYDFKRVSPDLILHLNQNNSYSNNQKLVCEIKMEGADWSKITKDFHKLIFYKLSRLNFQTAVFIYTGLKSDLDRVLEIHNTNNYNESLVRCLRDNNIFFLLPSKINKKTKNDSYRWEAYEIDIHNNI